MVSKVAERPILGNDGAVVILDAVESARAQLQLLVDRGALIDFDGVLDKLETAKMLLSNRG